ncbi:MAG TPA: hypothetical protein VNP72_01650 [Longimicrobium sp.]|nr:hypothetical protein [Longimicrobium sp.]
MKKLKQKQETPEERSGPGDYYEVICPFGTWYVSGQTAARIGRVLERRWRPRFVKFVDLAGSRAWLRTDAIEGIAESTERQRAASRDFSHLRTKEDMADRRWETDFE